MTDGARQMAQAALEGAMAEGNTAVGGLHASEAAPEDLLAADGYIFATPENLASMAGVMKDFFDRCYYPLLDQIQGRPYATMICAGSDGTGAARQIARIATGWRLTDCGATDCDHWRANAGSHRRTQDHLRC